MSHTNFPKTLSIRNLNVVSGSADILHDVSLEIRQGETHVLMGPNGSGKSTLLSVLMGHPKYQVTSGLIKLDGVDLLEKKPEERARLGLFLAFQYPVEVPGVTYASVIRGTVNALRTAQDPTSETMAPIPFLADLKKHADELDIDHALLSRGFHEGFSGGEKKKSEVLQMILARPTFAFLDEIDSGLDIDALTRTLDVMKEAQKNNNTSLVLVTHNPRLLNVIQPDCVHVMIKGRVADSGTGELAKEILEHGFQKWLKRQ